MANKKPENGAQFLHYFGPLLDALRELGGSGTPEEVVERIAFDLKLPDHLQNELLPSGELRFRNQVAWARFYLVQEGLLDSSKRGVWSLTERGRTTRLSLEQARQIRFKWVRVFQDRRREAQVSAPEPEQIVEEDSQLDGHRKQALELMQELSPAAFEQLCQAILREAGFVGVSITGRSGDQGVDGHGTLQINPLVSFRVLFQMQTLPRLGFRFARPGFPRCNGRSSR